MVFIHHLWGLFMTPKVTCTYLFQRVFSSRMSDLSYLKWVYFLRFGRMLNLRHPLSFNEKLNWLKLYNRNPDYTTMADKYLAKGFVASRIGAEYVVENYGVYDSWEDIDFNVLPSSFVVKCTHDSGGAYVCNNKNNFDFKGTKHIIERNLRSNFYYWLREWPYKNIKPRIIIDKLLDDHTGNELRDYKFWCFNGKPVYMYCTIKASEVYENFYDMDFNPIDIDHGFPRHQPEFEKPKEFDLMRELARKLSDGIPFVRVDFFDVEGRVYFGEFTFFDWGGMQPFNNRWDEKLGELLKLPSNNNG